MGYDDSDFIFHISSLREELILSSG